MKTAANPEVERIIQRSRRPPRRFLWRWHHRRPYLAPANEPDRCADHGEDELRASHGK